MKADLDALEIKLSLLLERHQSMREENIQLRQQAVALESANKILSERLNEARARVETLLNQIPE